MNKEVQSPFRWGVNEMMAKTFDESLEPVVEFDEEPALCLITSIAYTYFRVMQKDHDWAVENLKKTREILDQFDCSPIEKGGVSLNVLRHVVAATEIDTYSKVGQTSETGRILETITDSRDFSDAIDVATLHGCKSILYSLSHYAGCEDAITSARSATLSYPRCALWHYVLAKNLGRARRQKTTVSKLSQGETSEETTALEECQKLSQDQSNKYFYLIHVAKLYKKDGKFSDFWRKYDEVYDKKPTGTTVNLRLAEAFTKSKNFTKAKICLDRAQLGVRDHNSMYHHRVMGSYFRKMGDLETAATHLMAASESGNYLAGVQYAQVMLTMHGEGFDAVTHFESMKDRYGKCTVLNQRILLILALRRHYTEEKVEVVLRDLIIAIQLNPYSIQLEKFPYPLTATEWPKVNIFQLIKEELLPKLLKQRKDILSPLQY